MTRYIIGIYYNGDEHIIGLHVFGQWRRCSGYNTVNVALLSTDVVVCSVNGVWCEQSILNRRSMLFDPFPCLFVSDCLSACLTLSVQCA